ncbi:hypothetical protein D3C80_1663110 [compost metagenome]
MKAYQPHFPLSVLNVFKYDIGVKISHHLVDVILVIPFYIIADHLCPTLVVMLIVDQGIFAHLLYQFQSFYNSPRSQNGTR